MQAWNQPLGQMWMQSLKADAKGGDQLVLKTR